MLHTLAHICMKGKGGPDNQQFPYCGVRQRTWGKWVAEIREPNHGACLWLSTIDSALEARTPTTMGPSISMATARTSTCSYLLRRL
jgi:hypothetical protein